MEDGKNSRRMRTLSVSILPGARLRRRSADTTSATKVTEDDSNIKKLQELLQQSLRREADTLKKLRHLSEMYQELLYRSHSPASESKWVCADRYSPEFAFSPPDASTIATNVKSMRVMSPQLVVVNGERSPGSATDEQKPVLLADSRGENSTVQDEGNGWCATNGGSVEDSLTRITTSLAPLPQGLRDIRKEREKPPTFLGPEQTNTLQPFSNAQIEPVAKREDESSLEFNSLAFLDTEGLRKSKSPVDEHPPMNRIAQTKSLPGRAKKSTSSHERTGSFWKRRSRKSNTPDGPVEDYYDFLFKNFLKTVNTKADPLTQYLDTHWLQLYSMRKQCSATETKYRNAVWDLFQSEAKYFLNHLQPLEQVYKGFLEELHFYNILTDASPDKIFANISELVELSSEVANDLFKLFDQRAEDEIALPNELVLLFSMFGHKFNPVYKRFCTNFEQQRGYIKVLEKKPAFQEYLRVCRTAPTVKRKDLNDLLITPMQHQCHYQLLLEKVLQYTQDPSHRSVLSSTIKAFVVSLKELESAIAQQKCSLELLELQETVHWPTVNQLCQDAYLPESLEEYVDKQPCSQLLVSPGRHLRLQTTFKQLDSRGKPGPDIHLILLSDLLLVTSKKGSQLIVVHQPTPVSLISVHNVPENTTEKPTLTLIASSPLGQQTFLLSFMASSRREKKQWLSELRARGASSLPPRTEDHSEL